jgi:carotenoid cleavage dioxygenase
MVQALVFENGRADFRNRWIRTPKYLLEEKHGKGMFEWSDGKWDDWRNFGWGNVKRDEFNRGIPQGTNNINTFPFAGEILASGEQGGPPIALDPITLETKGIVRWSNQLSHGVHDPAGKANGNGDGIIEPGTDPDTVFTAHPKWDAETGELIGYAWSDTPPFVTIHVVQTDGTVTSKVLHDAPYNTVAHDMWLTPEHIVIPFQPFIASTDRITEGLGFFGWKPELPIVICLIPRAGFPDAPARYIQADIEPEYVMHTLSCNVKDNVLTLDAPIFNRPPFPFETDFAPGEDVSLFFNIARSTLGRWTVDLDTGRATSERLSDRPAELPKVDERSYGRGYRYGYMVGGQVKGDGMSMRSLLRLDMQTGSEQEFEIKHDVPAAVLEATFAPRRPGSPEGDGYLIVPISRFREGRGEYQLFDTDDITAGPVATIEIPFHTGWTPHGHWMDFR